MKKFIGIAGSLALCSAASAFELGTNEEAMSFRRYLAVAENSEGRRNSAGQHHRYAGNANGSVSSRRRLDPHYMRWGSYEGHHQPEKMWSGCGLLSLAGTYLPK